MQNAAARLITRSWNCDHITPILFHLHWLPVSERIKFKIPLLTFKALHQQSPTYIQDLITRYLLSRLLQSSFMLSLNPVSFNLKTYGSRAFSVSAPELWNKLPDDIRSCENLSLFKHLLLVIRKILFDSMCALFKFNFFKSIFILILVFSLCQAPRSLPDRRFKNVLLLLIIIIVTKSCLSPSNTEIR